MNQKLTPQRREYQRKQHEELAKILPELANVVPDLPEHSRLAQQHAAATAHRIRKKPVPDFFRTQRPPEKLPDPWLFNSESLLRELDRCRELVLQISIADHHATHFGINVAVDALWNLRDTLRYLLGLHSAGQRAVAKKSTKNVGPATQPRAKLKLHKQSEKLL